MKDQMNIILVDDNDIDIVVNTKLLKLANITDNVISFNRSENALDWLAENHPQGGFKDNVMLLDIQMPGTDGFQFLESYAQLSEEVKKSCRVFMLSSSIDRGDIERAEANVDVIRVLEKPLDVYLLKRLLAAE
jgi:CheY-like chemotaxis protein